MTKDKLNAALRVQALAHARNCVVAQNHATPNVLDMPALHELDALIDQGEAARVTHLENGLREVLDKMLEGYVDAVTILRLRRLVGIETSDAIMLSEVHAALHAAQLRPSEIASLAVSWANALEAAYKCTAQLAEDTVRKEHDARAALLRVLLPPGSDALRYL